jgi:hypothetical protein
MAHWKGWSLVVIHLCRYLLIACLALNATACKPDETVEPSAAAEQAQRSSLSSSEKIASQPAGQMESPTVPPTGPVGLGEDDEICLGVQIDPGRIDKLIQQILEDPLADLDERSVRLIAAEACQDSKDAAKCEACIREIIGSTSDDPIRRSGLPSDAQMRKLFNEHRAVFAELRDMILSETNLIGISIDSLAFWPPASSRAHHFIRQGDEILADQYSDLEGGGYNRDELLRKFGITAQRYDDYIGLLRKIGAYRLARPAFSSRSHPVRFMIYQHESLTSTLNKDIEFFDPKRFSGGVGEHRTKVECTDDMPDHSDWFAPLGDGWFIHFSRS